MFALRAVQEAGLTVMATLGGEPEKRPWRSASAQWISLKLAFCETNLKGWIRAASRIEKRKPI